MYKIDKIKNMSFFFNGFQVLEKKHMTKNTIPRSCCVVITLQNLTKMLGMWTIQYFAIDLKVTSGHSVCDLIKHQQKCNEKGKMLDGISALY